MKLPKWLVISLFLVSLVSLPSAGIWWWVTWPQRTARDFIDRLAAGERELAKQMFSLNPTAARRRELFFQYYVPADWRRAEAIPEPRTFPDVVAGRQRFKTVLGWRLAVDFGEVDVSSRLIANFVGQSPSGRTIGVGLADDTIEIVDLLLVTSLKPRSSAESRGGQPRSR
jgi:hypothetical protein